MIIFHRPKMVGDFNIAKNLSIINKSFCSGTDAGLGENESMTRIKEQPSYDQMQIMIKYCWDQHIMYCIENILTNIKFSSIKDLTQIFQVDQISGSKVTDNGR